MFCTSCGKKISKFGKFCKYCGTKNTIEKEETDNQPLDKKRKKILKISGIIWLISFISFFVIAALSPTNPSAPSDMPQITQIIIGIIVLIGVLSFLVMVFSLALNLSYRKYPNESSFKKFIRFIISLIFLPLFVMKSAVGFLLGFLVLLPIWGLGFVILLFIFGIINPGVQVIGNSMNPTLTDKQNVKLSSYAFFQKFFQQPKRGDIVVFKSGRTFDPDDNLASYVKRIVAVGGDEVSIRDGFLYINNQLVKESYTAKPRSTFGGSFLPDCKSIKVPNGYFFALGDNRKRSKDSREIGLISIDEIENILPVSKQGQFKDKARDANNDGVDHGLPSFDLANYYEIINKIRADNGLKPLKQNEKLEKAAIARAKSVIENNEVSKIGSGDNGKYSSSKAIQDAGYSNVITGEVITTGYYDSEELSNYWLDYETKKNLLNKEFQDTGIGAYVGKVDGCEIQVIVQEFGGYVPPNYSKATIDSWKNAVNSLNSVIPSWEKSKGSNLNQDDLNKLLDLMYKERTIASNISTKMESGKWLSNEDDRSITEYENLAKQSSALANKLNGN